MFALSNVNLLIKSRRVRKGFSACFGTITWDTLRLIHRTRARNNVNEINVIKEHAALA
jgi:hypothetical protein